MRTSLHEAGSESSVYAICGRSTRGTSAFGRFSVRGRRRVPRPPAMITSCIRATKRGARLSIFWPGRSLGDNRDDVVAAEYDGADPPDVVLLRLFRVLEDHVHVVIIADELPFQDPLVLEQELDPLGDGFF